MLNYFRPIITMKSLQYLKNSNRSGWWTRNHANYTTSSLLLYFIERIKYKTKANLKPGVKEHPQPQHDIRIHAKASRDHQNYWWSKSPLCHKREVTFTTTKMIHPENKTTLSHNRKVINTKPSTVWKGLHNVLNQRNRHLTKNTLYLE